MVKKITSAAFLLLVMVNHTFCDINNNKIPDKASKTIDESAKSSSKIKANKNKSDQKNSQFNIFMTMLTGISTTLLVLERLTFALTGESFYLWRQQETIKYEEVKSKLTILKAFKTNNRKVSAIRLWADEYNINFNNYTDEKIVKAIETLDTEESGYNCMVIGSETTKKPINKNHKLDLKEVVVRVIYNYIHGEIEVEKIAGSSACCIKNIAKQ